MVVIRLSIVTIITFFRRFSFFRFWCISRFRRWGCLGIKEKVDVVVGVVATVVGVVATVVGATVVTGIVVVVTSVVGATPVVPAPTLGSLRLLLTELKTLPTDGPRRVSTRITTITITPRINTYSTNPCPLLALQTFGFD